MTGTHKVRVGDQVHDGNADREGIITDVTSGVFILRPVHIPWGCATWTAPNDEELTLTLSREERLRRRREES